MNYPLTSRYSTYIQSLQKSKIYNLGLIGAHSAFISFVRSYSSHYPRWIDPLSSVSSVVTGHIPVHVRSLLAQQLFSSTQFGWPIWRLLSRIAAHILTKPTKSINCFSLKVYFYIKKRVHLTCLLFMSRIILNTHVDSAGFSFTLVRKLGLRKMRSI